MTTSLDKTLEEKLWNMAQEKNVNIVTFIAPEIPVRVSPIQFASASIDIDAMCKIEEVVQKCEEPAMPNKLHLVIHTPGGELYTSYKIANFLRSKFEHIHAFVPYQAASGGTLICCAANEITIGDLGNLTPIDPQVRYGGTWVSTYSFERAVDEMRREFGEMMPSELPNPWQQMTDKIDPVVYDEMSTVVLNAVIYAAKLLQSAGYEESDAHKIAFQIARTRYSHSHPILREQANEIGFNLSDEGLDGIMKEYTKLVAHFLKEEGANHIIQHYYPKQNPSTAPVLSTTTSQNALQQQSTAAN